MSPMDMTARSGLALPKGEPRRRVQGRQQRAEAKVKRAVRAACVRRDFDCRICDWDQNPDDLHSDDLDTETFSRDISEWAHMHVRRRSQTRGEAPEKRHTTAGSLMLCRFHHQEYDAHRLRITALSRKGCNGPLRFTKAKSLKSSDEIWAGIQREVAARQAEAEKCGIYHRGYRFWPPYACGRCGEPISAHQFAFSRSCGGCDVGQSHTARLFFGDPHWFVLGKVDLENDKDSALIQPDFIPAHTRRDFAVLNPMRPVPSPSPRPPKFKPPRRWAV